MLRSQWTLCVRVVMRSLRFVAVICGLFACIAQARAASQALYAATSSNGVAGDLYVIDPITAASTLVGPLLVGAAPIGITGLAFDPVNGILYGVTSNKSPNYVHSLVTINPQTAAATLIGDLGSAVGDISFSGYGTLYGWFASTGGNNSLCSINLTTGAATAIGPMGPAVTGAGIAFSPFGTLYVDNTGSILRTVDPATGTTTDGPAITGAPNGGTLNALAFNAAGILYGSNPDRSIPSTTYLVTVNTNTGAAATIGQLPDNTDALAFTLVSDAFQVRYVSNLDRGDGVINITNSGSSGGNICVNVYAFDPSEELVSCCSCLVTPNGLVSLSAQADLISNTLSPSTPQSLVIELVATTPAGGTCNPGASGSQAAGMRAWGTTLHALPTTPVTYGVTEGLFLDSAVLGPESQHLTSFCGFAQSNGSGFGICKSCRAGGLAGARR